MTAYYSGCNYNDPPKKQQSCFFVLLQEKIKRNRQEKKLPDILKVKPHILRKRLQEQITLIHLTHRWKGTYTKLFLEKPEESYAAM